MYHYHPSGQVLFAQAKNQQQVDGLSGTLYGGGPFTIEIEELQSLNKEIPVPDNIKWSIESVENSELLIDKLKLTDTTIKGRMAGHPVDGKTVLTFKLQATSNGRMISVFPVTLKFAEIFDL